ncbi:MAG: hypothetical protein J6A15_09720 [Clostridia bacterium]|nr:hypothetical protein [Clostridia bacterium]
MQYYICDFKNKEINILDEVEYSFIEQCNNTIQKLNYYSFIKGLHEIWIENTTDFFKDYSNTMKFFKEKLPYIDTNTIKKETLKCNKLLFNYLASFRTFVDKIQKTSEHMILGKEYVRDIMNKFYDENPEYAFVYKLRNFAIHYSMVFNSISVDLNKIEIKCTKSHLMAYNDWNEKNKKFILNFSENVPIYECIQQVSPIIEAIYLGFIKYFCEDVQVIDKELCKLFEKYKVENPRFIQCEDITKIKDGTGFTMLGFSYETYIEFLKDAKEIPGIEITRGKK